MSRIVKRGRGISKPAQQQSSVILNARMDVNVCDKRARMFKSAEHKETVYELGRGDSVFDVLEGRAVFTCGSDATSSNGCRSVDPRVWQTFNGLLHEQVDSVNYVGIALQDVHASDRHMSSSGLTVMTSGVKSIVNTGPDPIRAGELVVWRPPDKKFGVVTQDKATNPDRRECRLVGLGSVMPWADCRDKLREFGDVCVREIGIMNADGDGAQEHKRLMDGKKEKLELEKKRAKTADRKNVVNMFSCMDDIIDIRGKYVTSSKDDGDMKYFLRLLKKSCETLFGDENGNDVYEDLCKGCFNENNDAIQDTHSAKLGVVGVKIIVCAKLYELMGGVDDMVRLIGRRVIGRCLKSGRAAEQMDVLLGVNPF